MRNIPVDHVSYGYLKVAEKNKLQCYTPAGLFKSKKTGNVKLIERTGIMQLDFDYAAIKDYDIEELKQAIFSLPFIGYCGLSCTGNGFYALALVAEPERLADYARHCFTVLKSKGIQPDEGKGPKAENLRYISFDPNSLIRNNPEALQISAFSGKVALKTNFEYKASSNNIQHIDALVKKQLQKVNLVQVGERWQTIQSVSFTLGGLGKPELLESLNEAINSSDAFAGQEAKYLECAENCFDAGFGQPILEASSFSDFVD